MTDIHTIFDAPFVSVYSYWYMVFIVVFLLVCVFFVAFGMLIQWALFGHLQQFRVHLTNRETYKKMFLEKYTNLKNKKQELDQIDRHQFYTDMTFLWRSILYAKTDKKSVFSMTYTEMEKIFSTQYQDILEQLFESYFGEFSSKKDDNFPLRAKLFDAVEKWENIFEKE